MNNLATERFLTIVETAELLNVSVSQVYNLVHSGELPAIRVGVKGPWRVAQSVLEQFIAEQYEMTRRGAMWREAAFADVVEL